VNDPVEEALRRSLAERARDRDPVLDVPWLVGASRRRRRARTAGALSAATLVVATGLVAAAAVGPRAHRPETLAGPASPSAAPRTAPGELSRRVLQALGSRAQVATPAEALPPAVLTQRDEAGSVLSGRRRLAGAVFHVQVADGDRRWWLTIVIQTLDGQPLAARAVAAAGAGGAATQPVAAKGDENFDYAVFASGQGVFGSATAPDGLIATIDIAGGPLNRQEMTSMAIAVFGSLVRG
jgi:hypothetical protein